MIEVTERHYGVDASGQTAQYDALVADLTAIYDWTSVTDQGGQTTFVKMRDETPANGIQMMIGKSSGQYGCWLRFVRIGNGSSGAFPPSTPVTIGDNARLNHCIIVKSSNGFLIMACSDDYPSTANVNMSYATVFGIWKSKNIITGEEGFTTILQGFGTSSTKMYYNYVIGSKSTREVNFNETTAYLKSYKGIYAVTPVFSADDPDVPVGLLRLYARNDDYTAVNQRVKFNGKTYRRLTAVLVPED